MRTRCDASPLTTNHMTADQWVRLGTEGYMVYNALGFTTSLQGSEHQEIPRRDTVKLENFYWLIPPVPLIPVGTFSEEFRQVSVVVFCDYTLFVCCTAWHLMYPLIVC